MVGSAERCCYFAGSIFSACQFKASAREFEVMGISLAVLVHRGEKLLVQFRRLWPRNGKKHRTQYVYNDSISLLI